MEKYGFVYIWYDRKHKRYYIGCRWGREDDGYICSSTWMKQGYRHRPNDFRRRILSRIYTNKKELLEEEYRWLSKIKTEELGKKYYNLHNHHFGHWSTDENSRLTVGEKISLSPNRSANISKANKGRPSKLKGAVRSEETKSKMSLNHTRPMLGKKLSYETKLKMSLAQKGKSKSEEHIRKSAAARTGLQRSEETRKRMSEAQSGTKKPWAGGKLGSKDSEIARENKRLAALRREQSKREMKLDIINIQSSLEEE